MKIKILPTQIITGKKLQKVIVAAIFSLLFLSVTAQKGKTYFIHKVRKGESFRSIASQYNLPGKRLAAYNNLEFYEGRLNAKSLRVPKKNNKKDTILPQTTLQDSSSYNQTQSSSPSPALGDTSSGATEPKVSSDTTSAEINSNPGKVSSLTNHLPLLIYLSVSMLLLAAAISYYRSFSKK